MQSGNPNIREEVDDSRGLLKKIQLAIPLFRGYRKLEDIRVADELLRKEISNILQQAMDSLQKTRADLVNLGSFDKLTLIGSSLSRIQEFQGEMLHAQQGSTGISPAIRLDQAKLNGLYEYDFKFLQICSSIREFSNLSSTDNLIASLDKLSSAVDSARRAWESRIQAVEDILLSPKGGK